MIRKVADLFSKKIPKTQSGVNDLLDILEKFK